MADQELTERHDYKLPKRADNDGFAETLRSNHVTHRSHSGGFTVYLDGDENINVADAAARHGYAIRAVEVASGDFKTKIDFGTKINVWTFKDRAEHKARVDTDE